MRLSFSCTYSFSWWATITRFTQQDRTGWPGLPRSLALPVWSRSRGTGLPAVSGDSGEQTEEKEREIYFARLFAYEPLVFCCIITQAVQDTSVHRLASFPLLLLHRVKWTGVFETSRYELLSTLHLYFIHLCTCSPWYSSMQRHTFIIYYLTLLITRVYTLTERRFIDFACIYEAYIYIAHHSYR